MIGAPALDLSPIYQAAGQEWNVNPALLRAVAHTESGENVSTPDSHAGAQGVSQLMPGTAKSLGVQNPYDPVQSIYGSAKLLSQNLDQYGNVPDALRAYNSGTDPAKWGNAETVAYVPKVAAAYAAISSGQHPSTASSSPAAGMDLTPHPDVASPDPSASPAVPAGLPGNSDDFFKATAAQSAASPAGTSQPAASPASSNPADQFFHATTAGAVPDAPATAASAAATPAQPDPGFMAHFASGVKTAGEGLENAAYSAGDWANRNLPGPDDTSGFMGLPHGSNAATQQAVQDTGAAVKAADAGDNTWAYTGGKLAGNAAIGAPLAALGSAIAAPIGAAAGIADGATIGGRLLYSGLKGALGGAGAAAATSGSNQDQSLAAQMALGAGAGGVLGAAVPAIGQGVSALKSAITGDGAAVAGDAAASAAGRVEPTFGAAPVPPDGTASAAPAAAANKLAPGSMPNINAASIKTPGDAQAAAAQIIQHFAGGSSGDINPSATSLPGVAFNAAEATGNPGLGAMVKSLRSQNRQATNIFGDINATNNAARTTALDNIRGTPADIQSAEMQRDVATSAARNAAFSETAPVDTTPVLDKINELIDQNKGRPTVQAPMQWVKEQLQGLHQPIADDAPEGTEQEQVAAPEDLYNLRKYIGDIISPRVRGTAADGTAAAAQLMQLKPILDAQIESGAPGFKNYISQYDQMSRPINAMQWLQSQNLTDSQGNVTLQKLDSTIKAADRARAQGGVRLPDSLSDTQMQGLQDLRDHLQAVSQSTYNGRLPGSDTAQNLSSQGLFQNMLSGGNIGRTIGAGAGMLAGHAQIGATAGKMVGNALAGRAANSAAIAAARGNSLVSSAVLDALTDPVSYQNALAWKPAALGAAGTPNYVNSLAGSGVNVMQGSRKP